MTPEARDAAIRQRAEEPALAVTIVVPVLRRDAGGRVLAGGEAWPAVGGEVISAHPCIQSVGEPLRKYPLGWCTNDVTAGVRGASGDVRPPLGDVLVAVHLRA